MRLRTCRFNQIEFLDTTPVRDKKTLVLISDGGDNSSGPTKEEIFRLAEESLVTIVHRWHLRSLRKR